MSFWNKPHTPIVEKHEPVGIVIETKRSEVPEFKRIYRKRLDNRCVIAVEIKTFLGSRFTSGTLTQPNGNYVWFDIDRIADKIIDPVLVPLVEEACRDIRRLDKEFMDSDPKEYEDELGRVWIRK